jgi:hypothetical protein
MNTLRLQTHIRFITTLTYSTNALADQVAAVERYLAIHDTCSSAFLWHYGAYQGHHLVARGRRAVMWLRETLDVLDDAPTHGVDRRALAVALRRLRRQVAWLHQAFSAMLEVDRLPPDVRRRAGSTAANNLFYDPDPYVEDIYAHTIRIRALRVAVKQALGLLGPQRARPYRCATMRAIEQSATSMRETFGFLYRSP